LEYTVGMDIRLKPEMEEMIRREVERGAYRSVDEFVEHAVTLLHEEEVWLAENGSGIRTKIEQGFASAQRGELVDSERARQEMEQRKSAWIAEKRRA
jgi:putative addiction module CopG family antidote